MSVCGPVNPSRLGVTLADEFLVCDFSGADAPGAIRYDMEKAFAQILPELVSLKTAGCETLVESTPAYMGRNVKFLQRLSKASGLNILTNTGYSGQEDGRYLPASVETEKVEDIAFGWIREAWYGIGESGIRPGFIRIGIDNGGLTATAGKLFRAACRAHLETGLPILVQSADGLGVAEALSLMRKEGLEASALIWTGGTDAGNRERLEMARMGIRLSLGSGYPGALKGICAAPGAVEERGFAGPCASGPRHEPLPRGRERRWRASAGGCKRRISLDSEGFPLAVERSRVQPFRVEPVDGEESARGFRDRSPQGGRQVPEKVSPFLKLRGITA